MVCWGMYAIWPEEHLGVEEGQSIEMIANDSSIVNNNPIFAEFANHEVIKEKDEK